MYLSKRKISTAFVKRAAIVSTVFLVIIFFFIFAAFWSIQIFYNEKYTQLAIRNITRYIELPAPRGMIVDRFGRVLAENKINFTLFLVRENVENLEKAIEKASNFSGKSVVAVRQIIDKYKKHSGFYRIPIKSNLPLETVIFIQSRQDEFPEFEIGMEPSRTYPLAHRAAHVLGHISEITEAELNADKSGIYGFGDLVGRSGIENQGETFLQGVKGSQTVIKNNVERIQRISSEVKPEIGETVVLTLDLRLQEFIENLLGNESGAVGVLDLKTGGVLALVSKPDFNPEIFSREMGREEWQAISNDPQKPLQNKFLQGIYSPGSVFKIIMALAGLQEGIISPNSSVFCTGSQVFYDRVFHCWNPGGHGAVNIFAALQNSCNIYFYNLGKKMDIDTIASYARLMGLGKESGIDLPNEKAGLVPGSAWKMNTFQQRWFPGETISVSIGHGSLNVTPAQMLKLIATVALRGRMPKLHLLQRIEKQGKVVREFAAGFSRVPIDEKNFELIIEGLFRVVNNEGTGRAAKIDGLDICGKTGTSQIIAKENPRYKKLTQEKKFMPHSWFVSFAPMVNPRLAMVVLVEHGGDAGAIAAPLAAQIYKKYFENEGLL
ncbi:MAG: penicillin-binding protein 2 [Acidobacteria bacterium]|nr:penicillin-binding protein 2 [Acidobacteriota bacterium]MBU4307487.1 penicillin-binding protein 2 [Acidobacteriota bacterium]MBU4404794.1 penicillin-binding protein 2 [Acidobacteriota bacterium]MCG2811152.1 penicillin-binding protein 2 [Candidatus Aminicenantes bacterium]